MPDVRKNRKNKRPLKPTVGALICQANLVRSEGIDQPGSTIRLGALISQAQPDHKKAENKKAGASSQLIAPFGSGYYRDRDRGSYLARGGY